MDYYILRLKVEKIKKVKFSFKKNNVLEVGIGKNGPGILGIKLEFGVQDNLYEICASLIK
jgi:hypothetical protein